MATTILAAGTSAATSSDIELQSNQPVTLFLMGATLSSSTKVDIQFKRADGTYTTVYTLAGGGETLTATFKGPVTFRVSRPSGNPSCGVDRA